MELTSPNFSNLRNELLKEFPDLKPQKKFPLQIIWGFIFILGILAISMGTGKVISTDGMNLTVVGASLVLGLIYGSFGLYTHELLHGSIVKNSWLSHGIAFFGFFIFTLSPELWLTWHNQVHHYHTNHSGVDPDSFGLWEHLNRTPMVKFILQRAPGSKHFWSWVYLPLNFTSQAVNVMWFFLWKSDPQLYAGINRRLAVFETFLQYAMWIFAFAFFGWKAGIFLLFIPSLIANVITSSYILTQHLFCPLTEQNLPLENTLGVTTLPFLDLIHFNFSHHLEHHVFPEMNHQQLPQVRASLGKKYPQALRIMSHKKALGILMNTPRVYSDANTLWDPYSERTMNVSKVGRE